MNINFISNAQSLAETGNIQEALDIVYDNVDDAMWLARFEVLDIILQTVDVPRTNNHILLALLVTTLPARDRIPSRYFLFQKIETKFQHDTEDWNDTQTILTGLGVT